jgi:hypothetical protein
MKDLRDDAKKVIAKNFPADPLGQGGKNRSTSWWRFWAK